MASKTSYECYVCKKAGFPDTRVYLDGKTEDGKTIYKNEDMTPHQHKVTTAKQQSGRINLIEQAQSQQEQMQMRLKIINAKIDRIVALLEESQHNND